MDIMYLPSLSYRNRANTGWMITLYLSGITQTVLNSIVEVFTKVISSLIIAIFRGDGGGVSQFPLNVLNLKAITGVHFMSNWVWK